MVKMKLFPACGVLWTGMDRPDILLIEDNAGDIVLARRALEQHPHATRLKVARDGEEALRMLAAPGFRPELIILDLNMPRLPGYAVLERYQCRDVPVVIFSSSANQADVQRTLMMGAREYVRKPLSLKGFTQAVQGIVDRWLTPAAHSICPKPL